MAACDRRWDNPCLGMFPVHHVGLAETVMSPGMVVVRGAMGYAPLEVFAK